MAKTISEQQLALNRKLHDVNPDFGKRSGGAGLASRLPIALLRMHELGFCSSVLDYGTGKGLLVDRLKKELPSSIHVTGYDPAVERWSTKPTGKTDILTCLDVLEHVEIDFIDKVIKDIESLTKLFCYVVIDLQPAVKSLADGRNAHVLLAPAEWWIGRFSQVFSCISAFPIKHQSGHNQKIVLACTQDASNLPYVYLFLNKINVYSLSMKAGTLKS